MMRIGFQDLADGRVTPEALVLCAARTGLRSLGIDLPDLPAGAIAHDHAELALYETLGAQGIDDSYARCNAMLRELTSCLEAPEARRRRAA
jgi:hypothetical protein